MDNFSNFTKSSRVERFNHLSFYNLMPYLVGKGEGNQPQRAEKGGQQCQSAFTSPGGHCQFFSVEELQLGGGRH